MCPKEYKTRAALQNHWDKMHENRTVGYKYVKSVWLKFPCNRSVIMTIVHPSRCFRHKANGKYCNRDFSTKHRLYRHIEEQHENPKRFKCDVEGCSTATSSMTAMKQHKKNKHPAVPNQGRRQSFSLNGNRSDLIFPYNRSCVVAIVQGSSADTANPTMSSRWNPTGTNTNRAVSPIRIVWCWSACFVTTSQQAG